MSFVNPDAYLPDYPDGFPMSAEEVVEDLRAENLVFREALNLAIVWCRYRSNDGYDTCEDNCTKAYRYQERCPIYLPTVEPPATAELDKTLEKC